VSYRNGRCAENGVSLNNERRTYTMQCSGYHSTSSSVVRILRRPVVRIRYVSTAPSCGDGRGSCAAVFYDYARTLTTRRFLDQAVRVKRFHVCKTSSPSPQLSVHASVNLAAAVAAAQQLDADLLSDVLLVHSRPITGSSMI